ncbi:MAG: hypothetical protein K8S55_11135 [Phycisphaerae bacterium]|nr:hypothetical protein [Phycisphaerae bacterium]
MNYSMMEASIKFYCPTCGLLLNVPRKFSGGKGCCPRCRLRLRIPHPLGLGDPEYKPGVRYIAEPARERVPAARAVVVSDDFGVSAKYNCVKCREKYEDLEVDYPGQGFCPACKSVNNPAIPNVEFPRSIAMATPLNISLNKDKAGNPKEN